MLDKLNSEQEKLIPVIRDYWINKSLGGDISIDKIAAKKGIYFIYSLKKLKPPMVKFVGSPAEAQKLANASNGTNEVYPMGIGLGYDSHWTAFYHYFSRIGILRDKKFQQWLAFLESGAWDCILCENIAYVVKRPQLVLKDTNNRLHCENGPAVLWSNGDKDYFWHGVKVSEKLIMHPSLYSQQDIMAETNSEISRAIAEKLGWEEYLKRVETVLVDKWFDTTTSCHYELFDFTTRKGSLQPRLLRMESPELKDGNRPYYIEPVDPGLKTCEAARRWQFLKQDGAWPSVEECNENPGLEFSIEA